MGKIYFRWTGVLCALWLLMSPQAAAAVKRTKNFWGLGVGVYGSNLVQRFSVPGQFVPYVSSISGIVKGRRGIRIKKSFFFEPSLAVLLPWRSGVDGTTKTFTFQWGLDFSTQLFSFARFRFGPGIQTELHLASQQTVTLNNGGSTSSFYIPGRTTFTNILTVDLGLEFILSKRTTLNFDVYLPGALNNLRRRLNASVTLGWVW